jgi:predicted Zn-dependent peptidase
LPLSAEKLLVGYHAFAANDARQPALEILNEVLFEGDSSRLRRLLVTEGELASGFGAFVPAFAEPGLYEVSVDLRPGRTAEEAEAVLLAAFADVTANGLTEAEINKAKARLETRFYLGLQTAQHRAHGLGFWAATLGEPYRVFEGGEVYADVTGDAVKAVAAEVFRPDNRTVIIGRPSGAPPEGEDDEADDSTDGSADGSSDGEP